MEREILFRAKSMSNGEFVIGMPLPSNFGCGYMLNIDDALGADFYHSRYTMPRCESSTPIDEDTIGQFTGMKDANDIEIYEGDIVQYEDCKGLMQRGSVIYDPDYCSFMVARDNLDAESMNIFWKFEVIGNIYDNPDLLKD